MAIKVREWTRRAHVGFGGITSKEEGGFFTPQRIIDEHNALVGAYLEFRKAVEFFADPGAFNRVIPFAGAFEITGCDGLKQVAKDWLAYIDTPSPTSTPMAEKDHK